MNHCMIKQRKHIVTILILTEERLPLKDFGSYLYLSWLHVGPTQFVVPAQLGEDFSGFGCISPGIVPFSAVRGERGEKNGEGIPYN